MPALFSNFLAISRVGTEVQFEFVFLDLNHLAVELEKAKVEKADTPLTMMGKTVAKVVMPAASFIQLKEHINVLFKAIEEILAKAPEVDHERARSSSG